MNNAVNDAKSAAGYLKAQQDAASAEMARKAAEANDRMAIAFALDAALEGKSQPGIKFIHAYRLHGTMGSVEFEPMLVDDLLKLLSELPPIPRKLVRARAGTSYRLLASEHTEEERASARDGDGIVVKVDYDNAAEIEWWAAMPSGQILRLSTKLSGTHGLGPRRTARIEYYPGGEGKIREISHADIHIQQGPAGELLRYSAGSRDAWPMMFRWWPTGKGGGIEFLAALHDKLRERGLGLRSAYEADKALLLAGKLADLSDSPADPVPYAKRKLRAGTESQTAALESPEARAEWALIKRHPEMAAQDPDLFPPGIITREWHYGAEHYDWAQARLTRMGLLVDNGYKYGSAWL